MQSFPRRRRWWQHWFFKTCVATFVAMVIAIAGFYILERYLGEKAWRDYQSKAAAKGVKLRIEEYAPPPIPDEENYAAAPIFQKLFTDPGSVKETEASLALPKPPPKKPGAPEAPPFDLRLWQDVFVKAKWLPSAGNDPAADVLEAVARVEPILAEIRQASSRPKSRWPVNWSDGMNAKLPHAPVLQHAATAFALRARALLAQDKPDEAIAELHHSLRVARSLNGEPTLIPLLLRVAMWNQVLGVAEQGIISGEWPAAQLETLGQELAKGHFLEGLRYAMSSERGFGNQLFNQLATADRKTLANLSGSAGPASALESPALFLIPRGWIRRNQVEYNELIDQDLEDIDADNGRISPTFSRAEKTIEEYQASVLQRANHMLTSIILPISTQVANRAFNTQMRAEKLRVLCALSRYREAHTRFPETLDALVPNYLGKIPSDLMDGRPLRYRRMADGACLLWSIGENRVDDGGVRQGNTRTKRDLDWVTEWPAGR